MDAVIEAVRKVSVSFSAIGNDKNRSIAIDCLDYDRSKKFSDKLASLASEATVIGPLAITGRIIVDLPEKSLVTKYDLMDRVIIALQAADVKIG